MLTHSMKFEIELFRLLESEIERLKEQLAVNVFDEVSSFRYVMGQIAALRSVEDLIAEAKTRADQRNR